MEHRTDLEEILLSGLPEDERDHVVKAIREASATKLARLRANCERDLRREAQPMRELDAYDEDEDLYELG